MARDRPRAGRGEALRSGLHGRRRPAPACPGPNRTSSSSQAASSATRSIGSVSGAFSSSSTISRRGASRRDRHQRIEDRLVARLPPAKPLGQRRQNMRGLSEQFARLRERLRRQEFEEQRHVIRQFVRRDHEPGVFVHRLQIDHGLAAVAAFAVDVLEQMQRQRLAAVEQQAVALLQVVDARRSRFPRSARRRRRGTPPAPAFRRRAPPTNSGAASISASVG